MINKILLFLGVSLLPYYPLPSGLPQPSHIILGIFSVSTLVSHGLKNESWILLLAILTVYSFTREITGIVLGGDVLHLATSVFLAYNSIFVAAVYKHMTLHGGQGLAVPILIGSILALGGAMVGGVAFDIDGAVRKIGTFNNPNQLGYYAVCLLSISYLFVKCEIFPLAIGLSMYVASAVLAILSLSKAAMIACFVVIPFLLQPEKRPLLKFMWGSVVGFSVFILFYLTSAGFLDDLAFVSRLANFATESDSSLAVRGYFTLVEATPYAWIIGAGGSGVAEIRQHEVHSTLGSVFSLYGFIGLSIFGGIIFIWLRTVLKAFSVSGLFCIAGPVMLYGITHNGMRATMFWLLIALSVYMAKRYSQRNLFYVQ